MQCRLEQWLSLPLPAISCLPSPNPCSTSVARLGMLQNAAQPGSNRLSKICCKRADCMTQPHPPIQSSEIATNIHWRSTNLIAIFLTFQRLQGCWMCPRCVSQHQLRRSKSPSVLDGGKLNFECWNEPDQLRRQTPEGSHAASPCTDGFARGTTVPT